MNLESNKTYYLGGFIIRLAEEGALKVTSDGGGGVINIQPKADNAVEIKSSKN